MPSFMQDMFAEQRFEITSQEPVLLFSIMVNLVAYRALNS